MFWVKTCCGYWFTGAGVDCNSMKDWARSFYKSKAWKQTREEYARSRGWLCERCIQQGLAVPGEIVHHKIWLTPENINDLSVSLNWDNLELVCRQCHADTHERKGSRKRWTVGEDGRVISR